MIKDRDSYDRAAEEDRRQALRRMTAEDSIAIGEALLTSDLMRLAVFSDDDHPLSLAIALRIGGAGIGRRAGCHDGTQ